MTRQSTHESSWSAFHQSLIYKKIGFYGVLFTHKSTEKNTPDPPIGDRHGFFRVWLVRTRVFSDLKD
jgi:hypothetical protein